MRITRKVITFILIIILLTNNIIICFSQDGTSSSGTLYSEDTTTYIEEMSVYAENTHIYAENTHIYIERMTHYIEEMVYYQFGEYVDDIYVISLHTQEYIDRNTVIIDPESGEHLNIGEVISKLTIGATVIVVCVALTLATGGTASPAILSIVIPYVKVSAASAAVGAAIDGSISYVTSGGSGKKVLEGAIKGAADGFMWGAVLSPGAMKIAKLQMGKIAPLNRTVSRIQNFSEISRRTVSEAGRIINRSIHAFTEIELIARYGNAGRQLAQNINFYTTEFGYEIIQNILRKNINSPIIRRYMNNPSFMAGIERISTFLKQNPLPRNSVLFRGENIERALIAQRYGIRNIMDLSPREIAQLIKNNPSVFTEPAFTSTSLEFGDCVKNFAIGRQPKPSNLRIVREIRNTPNSTRNHGAAYIEELSRYRGIGEYEVLVDIGLQTKPVDAFVRQIESNGRLYDVLYIIEEIL